MKRLLILLLAGLMLTGCSGFANKDNIIDLLSSPKLSQQENQVVECITEYLNNDIILKYPKKGSNISPVQLVDISGDGVDEAIVMYTAPAISGNVRLALLSQTEDGWQVDHDTEGFGSEIYKIVYADFAQTTEKRIIVGYSYSDSSEKMMSVYFIDEGQVKNIRSQSCQDFVVQDVTGDGINDIVLAGVNADNQHTLVRVLSLENGTTLFAMANKQLPVKNAKVTNIAFSHNDFSDKDAILIDYTDVYYRVYTQRMYLDEYNLHTILDPDVVQKRWVYDYNLNSKDVDGDGWLETPTIIITDNNEPENLKFMEWTSFLKTEPVRRYYGVCEAESGIYFPLPDHWQNVVSLKYGEDENSWVVYRITDGQQILKFELLSTGFDETTQENQQIVTKGTIQVRISYDETIPTEQREYIANGMMYIK